MRRPFRFWMTGCAAVVMAGLMGTRTAWAADQSLRRLESRYGQAETEQRLFEQASRYGYTVFARIDASSEQQRAPGALIVFGTSGGGTPVVMASSDAQPSLPLSVRVGRSASGGTEVVCASADWELPPDVARELSALRRLMIDAVT